MVKKIIFLIIVLFLAGGGFFYWQQNQADVQELNKNLPEGVKVVKSLFGNEYSVVNKIDGYEFKIPTAWKGIKEIEYVPEETEEGYTASSFAIEGNEGAGRIASIDMYKVDQNTNLTQWAENLFIDYGLSGEFKQKKIGNYQILSTQEKEHLAGAFISFLHINSKIYVFTGRSEEFIREIILNGQW